MNQNVLVIAIFCAFKSIVRLVFRAAYLVVRKLQMTLCFECLLNVLNKNTFEWHVSVWSYPCCCTLRKN